MFKPTIEKRLADELYAHRRLLIDSEAKLLHAETVASQQKVAVELLRERVNELAALVEKNINKIRSELD